MRDTLVFGLKSDKVRRDAIATGNELTFQKVYEFAKVDESTRVQMKAITQHEGSSELHLEVGRSLHSSRSLSKSLSRRTLIQRVTRSHSRSHSSLNQRDASDVEATMTDLQSVWPSLPNANFVGNKDIFLRCA